MIGRDEVIAGQEREREHGPRFHRGRLGAEARFPLVRGAVCSAGRYGARTPAFVVLAAGSRIGMPGELLFMREPGGLLFATFVQQKNCVARAVWATPTGLVALMVISSDKRLMGAMLSGVPCGPPAGPSPA